MRSLLTLAALLVTLGSAFALYVINYDTRRLESEVQAKERHAERAENDIAVLKAERAFLARPERIEPAARSLGMHPPGPRAYLRGDGLVGTGR